jgi:hypothetical protein
MNREARQERQEKLKNFALLARFAVKNTKLVHRKTGR